MASLVRDPELRAGKAHAGRDPAAVGSTRPGPTRCRRRLLVALLRTARVPVTRHSAQQQTPRLRAKGRGPLPRWPRWRPSFQAIADVPCQSHARTGVRAGVPPRDPVWGSRAPQGTAFSAPPDSQVPSQACPPWPPCKNSSICVMTPDGRPDEPALNTQNPTRHVQHGDEVLGTHGCQWPVRPTVSARERAPAQLCDGGHAGVREGLPP